MNYGPRLDKMNVNSIYCIDITTVIDLDQLYTVIQRVVPECVFLDLKLTKSTSTQIIQFQVTYKIPNQFVIH